MSQSFFLSLIVVVLLTFAVVYFRRRAWTSQRKASVPVVSQAGLWAWGALIVTIVAWIFVLLFAAASCSPSQTADGVVFKDTTEQCADVISFYYVVSNWQSGLGAIIGLLGLAWTTFYNSLTKTK